MNWLRNALRKWLGIEELQHTTAELKTARSRPTTMMDRRQKLERRSYEMAIQAGSPFAQHIPPGVKPPQ